MGAVDDKNHFKGIIKGKSFEDIKQKAKKLKVITIGYLVKYAK